MTAPNKLSNAQRPIQTDVTTTSYIVNDLPLFSPVTAVLLMIWTVLTFIVSQTLGVYLFAPVVLQAQLNPEQRLTLGSLNGTVNSYAMLFVLVIMTLMIVGIIRLQRYIQRRKGNGLRIENHSSVMNQTAAISPTASLMVDPKSTSATENSVNAYLYANNAQKPSWRVTDYLALKPFSIRIGLLMMGMWLLFTIVSQVLTYIMEQDPTAFVDVLYDSAHPKWLLMVAMVVVAPIYEELMFRGVIWSALREQISGRGGVWLASLVTSLVFALIHFQYGTYELSLIFILALIMSYARYKSGSLWLPIFIHITNNGFAMLQYVMFN